MGFQAQERLAGVSRDAMMSTFFGEERLFRRSAAHEGIEILCSAVALDKYLSVDEFEVDEVPSELRHDNFDLQSHLEPELHEPKARGALERRIGSRVGKESQRTNRSNSAAFTRRFRDPAHARLPCLPCDLVDDLPTPGACAERRIGAREGE